MTTPPRRPTDVHPGARQDRDRRSRWPSRCPGSSCGSPTRDISHPLEALLFGLAIVGAAFMLSWAAEVAQLDISAGLAIAILALIAVLPEYAVDFVFAKKGGESFAADGRRLPAARRRHRVAVPPRPREHDRREPAADRRRLDDGHLHRVLPAAKKRDRLVKGPNGRWEGVRLDREHSIEIGYLAIATIYSLTLPLKHSVTLDRRGDPDRDLRRSTRSGSRGRRPRNRTSSGPASYLGTFADVPRRVALVGDRGVRRRGDPAVRRAASPRRSCSRARRSG